jgi:hypothetical protein
MVGEFDFTEYKDGFTRIVDAAHQHNLLNILLDSREVTGDMSARERLEIGRSMRRIGPRRCTKARQPDIGWPSSHYRRSLIHRELALRSARPRSADRLVWLR